MYLYTLEILSWEDFCFPMRKFIARVTYLKTGIYKIADFVPEICEFLTLNFDLVKM